MAKTQEQSSLQGVVHQAARRLRKKVVLFVCDDLWRVRAYECIWVPAAVEAVV